MAIKIDTPTSRGRLAPRREPYWHVLGRGQDQVDGYGTACLQPDGSWRFGSAQPESYRARNSL
jgi:hypothetical protein